MRTYIVIKIDQDWNCCRPNGSWLMKVRHCLVSVQVHDLASSCLDLFGHLGRIQAGHLFLSVGISDLTSLCLLGWFDKCQERKLMSLRLGIIGLTRARGKNGWVRSFDKCQERKLMSSRPGIIERKELARDKCENWWVRNLSSTGMNWLIYR